MTTGTWWASETFWRKTAIWVTAGSFVVLIFLTFDSMSQISAGTKRVPAYSAINHRIEYKMDEKRHAQVPVIGPEEPLFGKMLTEQEAEALVGKGKLATQAKNCMDCHDLGKRCLLRTRSDQGVARSLLGRQGNARTDDGRFHQGPFRQGA